MTATPMPWLVSIAPPSWLRSVAETWNFSYLGCARLAPGWLKIGRRENAMLAMVFFQVLEAEDRQPADEVLQQQLAIDFAAGAGSAGVHGEREFARPGDCALLARAWPGRRARSKVI